MSQKEREKHADCSLYDRAVPDVQELFGVEAGDPIISAADQNAQEVGRRCSRRGETPALPGTGRPAIERLVTEGG
jgi:hypothetical protein